MVLLWATSNQASPHPETKKLTSPLIDPSLHNFPYVHERTREQTAVEYLESSESEGEEDGAADGEDKEEGKEEEEADRREEARVQKLWVKRAKRRRVLAEVEQSAAGGDSQGPELLMQEVRGGRMRMRMKMKMKMKTKMSGGCVLFFVGWGVRVSWNRRWYRWLLPVGVCCTIAVCSIVAFRAQRRCHRSKSSGCALAYVLQIV